MTDFIKRCWRCSSDLTLDPPHESDVTPSESCMDQGEAPNDVPSPNASKQNCSESALTPEVTSEPSIDVQLSEILELSVCEPESDHCPKCGALYLSWPTGSQDYFERLGLSPNFNLDLQQLEARYLFLVNARREAGLCTDHDPLLDPAFRTLVDAPLRAAYLLSFRGHPPPEPEYVPLSHEFLADRIEYDHVFTELHGIDAHVDRKRVAQGLAMRCEERQKRLNFLFEPEHFEQGWREATTIWAELTILRELLQELEDLDEACRCA